MSQCYSFVYFEFKCFGCKLFYPFHKWAVDHVKDISKWFHGWSNMQYYKFSNCYHANKPACCCCCVCWSKAYVLYVSLAVGSKADSHSYTHPLLAYLLQQYVLEVFLQWGMSYVAASQWLYHYYGFRIFSRLCRGTDLGMVPKNVCSIEVPNGLHHS